MRKRTTLAGAVMVAVAATVGGVSGTATAEPPSCHARAEAPHYSTGAGGIIAKTDFYCEVGRSVTVNEVIMRLYLCPTPPSGPEKGWTTRFGCRVQKSEQYGEFFVPANSVNRPVTRYVPDVGDAAHGSGWWIQCTQYYRSDNPGVKYQNPSIARQVSG